MKELRIIVPGTPISVNHYVKHTRSGRHYVTKAARDFKQLLCLLVRRRVVDGERYRVEAHIYLGAGQRGDLDNFSKLIGDGLSDSGAIHSDAAIDEWHLKKSRDAKNPRTEITVFGLDLKSKKGGITE